MAHQQIWGELVVVALKAEDLNFQQARDIDPFCIFRVGNVVKKTKCDPGGGLHPIWDDQVNIPVAAGQNKLFVQIFNKDSNPVNLMADGIVDLNKVLRDKEHDGYFPLLSRGRPGSAKIYLELTFYPSQNNGAQRQPVRYQQPNGYPPVNFRPPPPAAPTQPMSHHTPVQQHRPSPPPHSQTYHHPAAPPPPLQQHHHHQQPQPQPLYRPQPPPPPPQQVVPPPMQYRPSPPPQHNRPPPAPIQTGYPPVQHRPGASYPPNPVHVLSPQTPSQPLLSAPYSPAIPTGSPHGQHVHHFPQPQPQPQPQYTYPPPQPSHNGPIGFHDPNRPPVPTSAPSVMYPQPTPQHQHNMVRPPPHQNYPPQQNYFPRPTN